MTTRKQGAQVDRYAAAVGTAIQKLRQEKQINGADLARRAAISYTTLHHIERGRAADMKTLLAIATALGVTVLEIVSRAEGAEPPAAAPPQQPEPSEFAHIAHALRVAEPAPRYEQTWAARQPPAITDEQRAWLDRLSWSLLRAADMTNRAATQVMLEELAVSIGLAVDTETGDDIRRAVQDLRRRRQHR